MATAPKRSEVIELVSAKEEKFRKFRTAEIKHGRPSAIKSGVQVAWGEGEEEGGRRHAKHRAFCDVRWSESLTDLVLPPFHGVTDWMAWNGCLRRCHDGSCRCSRPALRGLAISY